MKRKVSSSTDHLDESLLLLFQSLIFYPCVDSLDEYDSKLAATRGETDLAS